MKLLKAIRNFFTFDEDDEDDECTEVVIYLDDLTPEKQSELIDAVGDIGDLDKYPIISLLVEEGELYYAQ